MLCKVSFWNVSMKAIITREIFKVGSWKVGRFQWYCIHNYDWLIAALISEDLIVYDLFDIMIKLKVNNQFLGAVWIHVLSFSNSGLVPCLLWGLYKYIASCTEISVFIWSLVYNTLDYNKFPFTREYHVCGTYAGGGVHHSIFLPWTRDFTVGTLASLAFTCIKSECLAHAWGGWGVAGVSNDWCTTYFIRTKAWRV